MKKLIIILLFSVGLQAQTNSFDIIDRVNMSFDIELQNTIEIDGHTFLNSKSKDPIRFKATLDGIKIYDSKKEYQKRKCDKEKCSIIHLEPKSGYMQNGSIRLTPWLLNNTTNNIGL